MSVAVRFMVTNLVQATASVRSASSTDASFPLTWLLDQLRSKVWRSKLGWNVVAGFNDKLDFTEAGVARVATLAVANYATGALYAAQVQAAMNAAPGATNTYIVTYSASTKKFTIARATGVDALVLKFAAGAPNFATSCHLDLGYTSADKSGVSHEAENVAYHSREWLKVDLGSALAAGAAVVINHNLIAAGTLKHQANATDAWSAPTLDETLVTTMDEQAVSPAGRLDFFAEATLRWHRLLIEDVQNPDGFSEVGIWYAGTYYEPASAYALNWSREWRSLSEIASAVMGAPFLNARPQARAFGLEWHNVSESLRATLQSVVTAAGARKGRCFFLALDATNTPASTLYGFIPSDIVERHGGGDFWESIGVPFNEALG